MDPNEPADPTLSAGDKSPLLYLAETRYHHFKITVCQTSNFAFYKEIRDTLLLQKLNRVDGAPELGTLINLIIIIPFQKKK